MRRRSIAAAAAVVAVAAGIGVFVWYGWLRSPRLDELRAATDRFAPPAGWVLASDRSHDRAPLCVDAECPSVSKRWSGTAPVSAGELVRLASDAGWTDIAIEDEAECP